MSQAPRLIGVVVADEDELGAIRPALELLDACTVPHEVLIASIHLTPDELRDWSRTSQERGLQVILAACGANPQLPAAVAAQTLLPVVAVPPDEDAPDPAAWLRSTLKTAEGVPVATTGSLGPRNAALFAVEILARFDRRWEASILKYRAHLREKFLERAETARLRAEASPRSETVEPGESPPMEREEPPSTARPAPPVSEPRYAPPETRERPPGIPVSAYPSQPKGETKDAPPEPEPVPHTTKPGLKREPGYIGRIEVDSEILPIDVAENATDCLLDGGIVALPTDTVYGLAVDATHPDAVASLYDLKGREADKPVAIFIENQKQLTALVKNMSPEIRHMLEAFWPGPLTVVFERRSHDFDYLAPGSTIGVRLPDHSVALALLQELRRPIACSSANPSGAPPARSADEVEQYFGPDVHMILDVGKLPPSEPSTVIDVTREPYRLLREGPISRSQLGAVLGDLLEADEDD